MAAFPKSAFGEPRESAPNRVTNSGRVRSANQVVVVRVPVLGRQHNLPLRRYSRLHKSKIRLTARQRKTKTMLESNALGLDSMPEVRSDEPERAALSL